MVSNPVPDAKRSAFRACVPVHVVPPQVNTEGRSHAMMESRNVEKRIATAFVFAVASVLPHTVFAQKVIPPIEATIINTPAQPVPTTVQGTVTVQGAAAVTGVVGIDANANTVRIDSRSPMPVFDVDNPSRQIPLSGSTTIFLQVGGESTTGAFFSYAHSGDAAGKVRVVENVSGWAHVPVGDKVNGAINTSDGFPAYLVFHYQGTFGDRDFYTTNHPLRIVLPEGRILRAFLQSSNSQLQGQLYVQGYLVDATR